MDKRSARGILLFSSKCAAVTATIFAAAVVLSVTLASVAKDALALGKSKSADVKVSINKIDELAGALEDADIIEHPLLFSAYVKLCELDGTVELRNTTASVNRNMDYPNLLSAFTSPPPVKTVRISFPEGATTSQIIDIFLQNGIGTREGFVEAINSYPFEYDFIPSLDEKMSGDRLYRLDGYLYPDTYDFYTGRSEAYYIYKMLDRFCAVCSELGLQSVDDDKLTVASMIQASSSNAAQYEYLSAVFSNRLEAPEVYPYLACPATSAYALGRYGVYVGVPTGQIKDLVSPYNTFITEGLPPGAICNPGKHAIAAAYSPATSSYKYFLTLESGDVIFSVTEKEHEKNCNSFFNP